MGVYNLETKTMRYLKGHNGTIPYAGTAIFPGYVITTSY
jgi:hypothetical protein